MENAPNIILYGYFSTLILVITITLVIIGSILIKNGKSLSSDRIRFWGRVCITLSVICSMPIVLSVGYILYLYIG